MVDYVQNYTEIVKRVWSTLSVISITRRMVNKIASLNWKRKGKQWTNSLKTLRAVEVGQQLEKLWVSTPNTCSWHGRPCSSCPRCEVLRGRAKCRRYENKGTCVSKNYMITWRNTHITEVAETSQYATLNRLLSARAIKRRSSRGRSHIPQYDMM